MGGFLSVYPWLLLVEVTLPDPPQRQADRRIIVIKPKAEKIAVCVALSVHLKNLSIVIWCLYK
jgi:hypothetical protein